MIDELTNQLFSSSSVSHQSFESKQSFDEFIVIKLYMMTLLFILKVENCVTLMISGGCDWSSMLDQPPVVKAVDQSGKHTSWLMRPNQEVNVNVKLKRVFKSLFSGFEKAAVALKVSACWWRSLKVCRWCEVSLCLWSVFRTPSEPPASTRLFEAADFALQSREGKQRLMQRRLLNANWRLRADQQETPTLQPQTDPSADRKKKTCLFLLLLLLEQV